MLEENFVPGNQSQSRKCDRNNFEKILYLEKIVEIESVIEKILRKVCREKKTILAP